jgi:uncharacterized protein (TIGR03435 family)
MGLKLLAALLIAAALLGQTGPAQTFEVASVKRSAQQNTPGMILSRPGQPEDPGRIAWTSVSLKALVEMAYHVDMDQVGGPQWIEDERYEIIAKKPPETTLDQLRVMVQNLLQERFHMAAHVETRPRLEYALVVAKGGPKLKAAQEKPGWEAGDDHIQSMNTTVAAFAGLLSGWLHRPVRGETGVQGKYDITLHVAVADLTGMGANDTSIFNAVQELGLKVESRSVPDKYVAIDKADRIPTEN